MLVIVILEARPHSSIKLSYLFWMKCVRFKNEKAKKKKVKLTFTCRFIQLGGRRLLKLIVLL